MKNKYRILFLIGFCSLSLLIAGHIDHLFV